MTRNLFVFSIALLFVTVGLLIAGVTAVLPGLLIMGVMCAAPATLILFGAALGRASNEYELVSKQRVPSQQQQRARRIVPGELS